MQRGYKYRYCITQSFHPNLLTPRFCECFSPTPDMTLPFARWIGSELMKTFSGDYEEDLIGSRNW